MSEEQASEEVDARIFGSNRVTPALGLVKDDLSDFAPIMEAGGGLFYHYTDGAGLMGILKTRAIWLSDALHMNDSSELTYGVDKLAEAVGHLDGGTVSAVAKAIFVDAIAASRA